MQDLHIQILVSENTVGLYLEAYSEQNIIIQETAFGVIIDNFMER